MARILMEGKGPLAALNSLTCQLLLMTHVKSLFLKIFKSLNIIKQVKTNLREVKESK